MSKKNMNMILILAVGYMILRGALSARMSRLRPRQDRQIPLWGQTNRV